MNKLVMGSLLSVFATTFAGCIFTSDDTSTPADDTGGVCGDGVKDTGETCDDGNVASGDGCAKNCQTEVLTTANWSFATAAFNGAGDDVVYTPTQCPVGFDTAVVISQAVDANGALVGSCGPNDASDTCFIDIYDCTDFTGTETVPEGTYYQWVAITDHATTGLWGNTPGAYADITGPGTTFTGQLLDNGGYFTLHWKIVNGQNQEQACSQIAGQDGVEAISTVSGGAQSVDDKFTCDDGYGITAGFPEGNYTISVDVSSPGGSLGTAPTFTKTLGDQNDIQELGLVTIPLD